MLSKPLTRSVGAVSRFGRAPCWGSAILLVLSAAAMAQPPRVPTVQVQASTQAGAMEFEASLQPVKQSTISAQVPGNVTQLLVKAGDKVVSGQLIARIDEREANANVSRNQAAVAQANAEWQNAQLRIKRSRELYAQGFISRSALDDSQTQYDAARAARDQAVAGRREAGLLKGFATVSAPYAGVVLATHVQAGELASAGKPLVTIYEPEAMRAVAYIPVSSAAALTGALQTQVQLPGGAWVAPVARTTLPAADPVSQTMELRLDLARRDTANALPGQSVRVRFDGAPVSRLVVPAASVLQRGELTAVYVVQADRFSLRAIRLGAPRADKLVEVLAGLQPTDHVALDPIRAGLAGAAPAAESAAQKQ